MAEAKVRDIMAVMEDIAPAHLAESWDKPGLAVGNPDCTVKKVLVALDVTKEVIEEAIKKKADMIVTHHPFLLFRKLESITADTPLGKKIYDLISHNIAAFSAHTNLDIAKGGTNDVLADLIGLTDVTLLEETFAEELEKLVVYVPVTHKEQVRDAMCKAGAGCIGNYAHCTFGTDGEGTFLPLEGTNPYLGQQGTLERAKEVRLETVVPVSKVQQVLAAMQEAHPYEEVAYDRFLLRQKGKTEGIGRIGVLENPVSFAEFAENLRKKLGLSHIRLTGEKHTMIKKVALCTGSGASLLDTAIQQEADAYLTGDMKFHEAQTAVEAGICVADVTHYASEVLIVPVLREKLEQAAIAHNWDMEVICSEIDGQTFWSI